MILSHVNRLKNAAQTFETDEYCPHRLERYATRVIHMTHGAMTGLEVEQDMDRLVVEGRRGAGIGVHSYSLSRLIPPIFSCHHGALPFQSLAGLIFRSSFSYTWQATPRTFTLSNHSIPKIHSFHSLNSKHSLMARNIFLLRALHLRPFERMSQLHLPTTNYSIYPSHTYIYLHISASST